MLQNSKFRDSVMQLNLILLLCTIQLFLVAFLPQTLHGQTVNSCNQGSIPTLCQQHPNFEGSKDYIEILAPIATSSITNWTGLKIYLNAKLTVDNNFVINNCDLKMGSTGEIEIITGGKLESYYSDYFACGNMWPGIKIQNGGQLQFQFNNIEDAWTAIQIRSTQAVSILYNYFNRNSTGIGIPSTPVPIVTNALIVGNNFNSTSQNNSGLWSLYGISCSKAFATVGMPIPFSLSNKNTFTDHSVQVLSTFGSVFNMHFADFNCAREAAFVSDYPGTTSKLTTGPNLLVRNTFRNNIRDFISNSSSFTVEYSDFYDCRTSNIVASDNYNAQNIRIFDNFFYINDDNALYTSSGKAGIVLDRSSGGTAVTPLRNSIRENKFAIFNFTNTTNGLQKRSAIKVKGYPGTNDRMAIDENLIAVEPGGSLPSDATGYTSAIIDVEIGAAGKYIIEENFISSNNIDNVNYRNRWGIYLHDWASPSSTNQLKYNQVFGSNLQYDYGMCAYHFVDAGPWDICRNISDHTLRGFHVSLNCGTSNFRYNTMREHNHSPLETNLTAGLLMEQSSILGLQYCKKNEWIVSDYSPDYGAWHKGGPVESLSSQFSYEFDEPLQKPNPVIPASFWFNPLDTCQYQYYCLPTINFETDIDDERYKTIIENQEYEYPNNVREWERRKDVLVQLLRYPDLISDGLVNTFFNAHINTSAGLFAILDNELQHAMVNSPAFDSLLEVNTAKIESIVLKVDSLDTTLSDSVTLLNVGNSFFQYRRSIILDLETLIPERILLNDSISAIRNQSLSDILSHLAILPENEVYEFNYKKIKELEIKKILQIPISETDYSYLESIAQQCLSVAGKTVNGAKNLLPESSAFSGWPDGTPGDACGHTQERAQPAISVRSEHNQITISPNPTSDKLTIQFKELFTGSLYITDILGQVAIPGIHVSNIETWSVPMAQLKNGTYFLKVQPLGGTSISMKVVVAK
jgi:hypothetical protein